MYFDFEDYRPEYNPVGSAISIREGVLLSIIVHLGLVIFLLLTWQRWFKTSDAARQQAMLATVHPSEPTTFVFIPNDDVAPKAPERAEPSDLNRVARAREQAPKPENPLPFSRGNSPNRLTAPSPPDAARGSGPQPEPQAGPIAPHVEALPPPEPQTFKLPPSPSGLVVPTQPQQTAGNEGRSAAPGGALGNALSNLQHIIQSENFRNLQGGVGQKGDAIQFDSKGVEFGPWLRRFIAQVYANWNVPQAAMTLRGHVVITFNVHKSGALTDVTVINPSSIESFNGAAYGSLIASNPTQPLPPEYPDEKAFFTVTFYYNEDAK